MPDIHPTALVHTTAQIESGVEIGPFAVIEQDVRIGSETRVGAHSVIKRYSHIGTHNTIAEHTVIGGTPQDLSFKDAPTYVQIGNHNLIREGVTIHRASKVDTATRIGDHNYLMAYSHVAHDCILGDHIVMANNVMLAGHVSIGDRAFLSGAVGVHQFCRVGTLCMIGGIAKITQDCLPYMTYDGAPALARGLNLIGLKRAGFATDVVRQLKDAYRIIFRSGLALKDALARLEELPSTEVAQLVDFTRRTKRGFHRASAGEDNKD